MADSDGRARGLGREGHLPPADAVDELDAATNAVEMNIGGQDIRVTPIRTKAEMAGDSGPVLQSPTNESGPQPAPPSPPNPLTMGLTRVADPADDTSFGTGAAGAATRGQADVVGDGVAAGAPVVEPEAAPGGAGAVSDDMPAPDPVPMSVDATALDPFEGAVGEPHVDGLGVSAEAEIEPMVASEPADPADLFD